MAGLPIMDTARLTYPYMETDMDQKCYQKIPITGTKICVILQKLGTLLNSISLTLRDKTHLENGAMPKFRAGDLPKKTGSTIEFAQMVKILMMIWKSPKEISLVGLELYSMDMVVNRLQPICITFL